MVRRYPRQLSGASRRKQRLWLEVAGQRRLRRLHQRLKLQRAVVQRWSTFLDDVDEQVKHRLDELGDEATAYDTAAPDVMQPFRGGQGLVGGQELRPRARAGRRAGARR